MRSRIGLIMVSAESYTPQYLRWTKLRVKSTIGILNEDELKQKNDSDWMYLIDLDLARFGWMYFIELVGNLDCGPAQPSLFSCFVVFILFN